MRLPIFIQRLLDTRGEQCSLWIPPRSAKPRVRITQNGWITHPHGQPFPFHPKTIVEIRFEGGWAQVGSDADYARACHDKWWRGDAVSWKFNVVSYRIVGPLRSAAMSSKFRKRGCN